ncbi:WD40 repeat-like protein [Microthyrium microscopicum]|uniref:WD40 repeat-like protein n=1 Tax=Microthyrium microscopicum TaxID=703497 RepID=A0A6A6UPP8_9PEZI|nr:WD40 repeat-like protein [Microthyrium microscopicum]
MKTDFRFDNLLGTVYGSGNLAFTPDGTTLLSPVGNRVTVFDLVKDKSHTLPFTHRRPISHLALHPSGQLLLTIDQSGRAILSHLPRRLALYYFTFKSPVTALAFSPCGKYFAAATGRLIEIWHTPQTPASSADGGLAFAPFELHRRLSGHYDEITSVEWSGDSRFFLTASKDLHARVWSFDPVEGFVPTALAGHRQAVVGAWFSKDQESIWTISKDGALFQWEYSQRPDKEEEELQWRVFARHYFKQTPAYVSCAAFHPESNLLVTGFSTGIFMIHELPDFTELQTLSVSQTNVSQVIINSAGNWLALSSAKLSQLLVWDWQSESYILKQQSHHDSLNALAYTPDAQRIVTCADDGKIKLWDVRSGFCSVTFTEHSSGVTACEFAKRGNILFTASLDGSVRAWDLLRYRNFRTFTAPAKLGFSCLAVDPSGEVVAAGSHDTDTIHIWSVQTGQLLDQLAGHEGPISCLAFTPDGTSLISGSWDNTVRIWSIFARQQSSEPLTLQANVLSLAVRPDSKQIAVATLDGQLSFWSIAEGAQINVLDGRRDVSGGRKLGDRRTAANVADTKAFDTLAYSADGTCILAAGKSKYICLYECTSGVLLKKFTVSVNLALDGTQEFLSSRNLTDAGPVDILDDAGDASDLEDRIDRTLPGATRGDASVRRARPEIRVAGVQFAPSGRGFCAASTEGLLVYDLDVGQRFDPFELDVDVTPATTHAALASGDYLRALVMAFRLNEAPLLTTVYEAIPAPDIPLVVRGVPDIYLARLLRLVVKQTESSPHLEFCLRWLEALMTSWGRTIRQRKGEFAAEIRAVTRVVQSVERELRRLGEGNGYMVDYLLKQTSADATDGAENGSNDVNGLNEAMDEDGDDEGEWEGAD